MTAAAVHLLSNSSISGRRNLVLVAPATQHSIANGVIIYLPVVLVDMHTVPAEDDAPSVVDSASLVARAEWC